MNKALQNQNKEGSGSMQELLQLLECSPLEIQSGELNSFLEHFGELRKLPEYERLLVSLRSKEISKIEFFEEIKKQLAVLEEVIHG
ncbi:MAG: hypothetical protein UU48_C0009G0041 [Candidatus Uhrbacteria bacterium GW2011_GWF2_41_16]|uniref:Uncharacterized protein n=2 Tax=Candidatus Uhriibacteriota TaxID=1752732 RepID=A0A0G0VA16_9BACT|nr:MAG: hypothetical protein UU35_C0011G0039 [Candidatus Uhrbacteria bacterium GW2011_GWC2_41_11]KKR97769.1 MAG: hypothetical protein UU48_C0009G0041 [Candidatus Uhrbacteria bacterium GW2011_GWF2_41_16]HBO99887.1 hypothetical protein [Candidatus Uhrbacteria bacterium]